MAQSPFVPKEELLVQLNKIISQQETGLLTILTEQSRSIFLRFSQGRLTRLRCRSGATGEAIQMLAESVMLKYSYAVAPEESEPELIPAENFLQLINPGGSVASTVRRTTVVSSAGPSVGDSIRLQMLEIAIDYMGVVAEMIVDEAFEADADVGKAIDYISNAIPDVNQSRAFRESALKYFSLI